MHVWFSSRNAPCPTGCVKSVAIAILVTTLVGCATRAEAPAQRPRGLELRRVLLLVPTAPGDSVWGVFDLVNQSSQPFDFAGYALDRPEPHTTTQILRWFGWVLRPVAGCGTGITVQTLEPGRSVRVTIPIYGKSNERVRAAVYDETYSFAVTSQPFRVPSIADVH